MAKEMKFKDRIEKIAASIQLDSVENPLFPKIRDEENH
jgi:hypothetical protein